MDVEHCDTTTILGLFYFVGNTYTTTMVTVLPLKLLPQEVWLSIFSYLDGESLQLLMLTDSIIEHWLDEELFWFQKCQRGMICRL